MEDMELICLQIISNAGEARSESMAALAAARNSRFDEAADQPQRVQYLPLQWLAQHRQ